MSEYVHMHGPAPFLIGTIIETCNGVAAAALAAKAGWITMRDGITKTLATWRPVDELLYKAGYAASTSRQYASYGRAFIRRVGRRMPRYEDVDAYLRDGLDKNRSLAWYNTNLAALRAIFDTVGGGDITAGIPYLKYPQKLPPPRPRDIWAMLEQSDTVEDKLGLHLLRIEELRPGQVAGLHWSRVHANYVEVGRWHGHEKVWKKVALSPETRDLLRRLRKIRELEYEEAPAADEPVLGKSLRGFERHMDRLCERAGIRISPARIRKNGGSLIPPEDPRAEAA